MIFRTNCKVVARTSSSVAGVWAFRSVLMLRHMALLSGWRIVYLSTLCWRSLYTPVARGYLGERAMFFQSNGL